MTRVGLLLVLLTAACAAGQPAPIIYGGAPALERARAPAAGEVGEEPAPPPARQSGGAAPDWAAGEGTPLSAYALRPQEAQPFDPARPPSTHRVRANETLFDIAETYQIPLRALIEQNGLDPPYAVTPGRTLQLPPPRVHEVARGESFEDVARSYNVDLRSLALLNRMQPPYRARAGDRIVLPALARPRAGTPPAPPAVREDAPTPRTEPRFAWPLRGEILARFGPQPGGARLDGIEIAGREGAAIAAAADGEVVYAGSDLPAYGTLVLVRHADNYVSAYGFARRALVREGQRVSAGQPIAELGQRPDGRARLLFQVRLDAAAVDPAPLLGAAQ